MGFIQVTDPHCVAGDRRLFNSCPRERLASGVRLINRDHADADFVLVTGDLVHEGDIDAYLTLKEVLGGLAPPLHLMLGNHDDRAAFRTVFPDQPSMEGGFLQFVVESGEMRILCLDTLGETADGDAGRLCDSRLAWIDREIAATPAHRPLLVAMHHPPMTVGVQDMDDIRLIDHAALLEVFAARRPDLLLIGHVHRPISGTWHGIPFHIQRGFNHQVHLNFDRSDLFQFVDEYPDITLISATSDGLRVHQRSVGGEMGVYSSDHR